ncbi:hypothetical protein AVEN_110411-1, partial [Araneus ventricosus]
SRSATTQTERYVGTLRGQPRQFSSYTFRWDPRPHSLACFSVRSPLGIPTQLLQKQSHTLGDDSALHRRVRTGNSNTTPFVTYLHRFGLCSNNRCLCGDKGDPAHCSVTKTFHFMKPSAENLSTRCENIVQNKRSLARLMNIMKKDLSRFHQQLKHSLQTVSAYFMC